MTSLDSFFTVTVSDNSDENDEELRHQNGQNQVDTRKRARKNPEHEERSSRERLTSH
jgi:hypothetical protein